MHEDPQHSSRPDNPEDRDRTLLDGLLLLSEDMITCLMQEPQHWAGSRTVLHCDTGCCASLAATAEHTQDT